MEKLAMGENAGERGCVRPVFRGKGTDYNKYIKTR